MTAPQPSAAVPDPADVEKEYVRPDVPAWIQAVTPAEIVRQRSLKWPDFHPEDFCHQCGRRNPCWFADTAEWQTATGSTGDGGGVLCPSCFAALWESKTGKTAIIWRLSIDPRSRDAAVRPSPDSEAVVEKYRTALAEAIVDNHRLRDRLAEQEGRDPRAALAPVPDDADGGERR